MEALVEESTLAASDTVLVAADWEGDIDADGGTASLGGIVGIGGTIVLNTLLNNVKAAISGSTVTAGGNGTGKAATRWSRKANESGWEDDRLQETVQYVKGVAVIAAADEELDSAFASASVGFVGLAVNKAVNLIGDTVAAKITDSTITEPLIGAGGVFVRAGQVTAVNNQGGAAGVYGLGVVGGFDTTIIDTAVTASISNTTDIKSVQAGSRGVEVSAWSQEYVFSRTGSAAANLVGAAGAVSAVSISGDTKAFIKEADITTETGGIAVTAQDIAVVTVNAGALSASLIAGAGGSVDYVSIDRDTTAKMVGVHSNAGGSTSVAAASRALIEGRSATAGGGGLASIAGATSIHTIQGTTEAVIHAGSRQSQINQDTGFAGNGVSVTATDYAKIDSRAGTYSASLGAGFGASLTVDTIRRNVSALIGDQSQVRSGGDITVKALAAHYISSSATAFAGAVGVGIAGTLAVAAIGGAIDDEAYDEVVKVKSAINDLLDLSGGIDGLLSDDVAEQAEDTLAEHDLTINSAISSGAARKIVAARIDGGTITASGNVTVKAIRQLGAVLEEGQVAEALLAGVGGSAGFLAIRGRTAAVIGQDAAAGVDNSTVAGAVVTAGGAVTLQALTEKYDNDDDDMFLIDVVTGNGGIAGIGSAVGKLLLVSDTDVSIGRSSSITADGKAGISAESDIDTVNVRANGTVSGFYADGDIDVAATGALRSRTVLGTDAAVTAGGNLDVLSIMDVEGLTAAAAGGLGGLVAQGGQKATVAFTAVDATISAVTGELTAGGAATVYADTASSFKANVYQVADDDAVATDRAKAYVTLSNRNAEDLSRPAVNALVNLDIIQITADSIAVQALVSRSEAVAKAVVDTRTLGVDADAVADVDLDVLADVTLHVAIFDAPSVTIEAQTLGLNADSESDAEADSGYADVYSEALNFAMQSANIQVNSGVIRTHDLFVYANTLDPASHYGVAAKTAVDAAVGKITTSYTRDGHNQYSAILGGCDVYYDVTYDRNLTFEIDSAGNVVKNDGDIPYNIDSDTGAIVVGSFFYNGSLTPPTARFCVSGSYEIGNTANINCTFYSHGVDTVDIINNSSRDLVLGFIVGDNGEGVEWLVDIVAPYNYSKTNIKPLASYPESLNVYSKGDIVLVLGASLELPTLTVTLESEGDIWFAGSNRVEARQLEMHAGGNIGTAAKPLYLYTGGPISIAAGGDLYLEVVPVFFYSAFETLKFAELTAGGILSASVFSAVDGDGNAFLDGDGMAIATKVLFSGPVSAGGALTLEVDNSGGHVDFRDEVTAGGDIGITAEGLIQLFSTITTPGKVTMVSTGGISFFNGLITAHDVDLHTDTYHLANVRVHLTGGAVSAVALDGYAQITSVGGPLTMAKLFVGNGLAILTAEDTEALDDMIVLAAGSALNVKNGIWLNAGDGIQVLGEGTSRGIITTEGEIHITLDATPDLPGNATVAYTDPDPGVGATFTFDSGVYQLTGTSKTVRLQTGADADTILLPVLAEEDYVLSMATGAGDDNLTVGRQAANGTWSTDLVKGQILFYSEEGYDTISIDNSGVSMGEEAGSLVLTDTQEMLYTGPSIAMSGMSKLWYLGVESLAIKLAHAETNTVAIDATGEEMETVSILGSFGNEDFIVGGASTHLLSSVHGVLTLNGGSDDFGTDTLAIVENNFLSGLSFPDDVLTATSFTGQGMDGVHYLGMESLSLTFGSSDDTLVIEDTPQYVPATIDLGGGDDAVFIGGGNLETGFGGTLTLDGGADDDTIAYDDSLYAEAYTAFLNGALFARSLADGSNTLTPAISSTGFEATTILLGSGGGTLDVKALPTGTTRIVGGAGADDITLEAGPASGSILDISAGAGDDTLRAMGSTVLASLAGAVFFAGGEGSDQIRLSAGDAAAGTNLFLKSPDSLPLLHSGETGWALIQGLGMGGGIFYGAEDLEITLTNHADTIELTATSATTDSVALYGEAGNDAFYAVGGANGLDELHGDFELRGQEGTDL
ncbi:MAG TPA: hypothetical protein PKY95_00170, partial [candidate division Zixibacteria bacterium]|nr:hypothetical protein [candidate division Zixibacteria bacterium]